MRLEIILQAAIANLVVAVSAFGFGSWIPRVLPNTIARPTQWLCALIGGFGLLGLLLFIVGHVSLTRTSIGIVLAVGVLASFTLLLRPWPLHLPLNKLPLAVVAAVLAITAIAGLAEPVGDWNTDGVAYHFLGPKVWLHNGIVRPIADNAPSSYPSTVEMVFTAELAFGGDRAPGLSAVWTFAFFLAIAASLGVRCGLAGIHAWWIAALLATMGALYEGSHSGFVDAVYAAFILAAIRVGLDATENKHFLVFGFFCGLAMATKYPALVAFPFLLLCIAWPGKNRTFRQALPAAAGAAAVACIVALPIYLKNWILLGTPIYPPPPGVARFFHVKYFSPLALQAFYKFAVHRGDGHGRALWHFFTLPFNLTYHTADFHGAGGIGLAPLAFAPFGVIASWRDGAARRLAIIGVLLLLLWFLTMQESRYIIHFYGIAAVFAVLGWRYVLALTPRRVHVWCAVVIAISVFYGLYMVGTARASDLHAVFSPSFARQRRMRDIPFVESFDFLNRDSSVTSVLILDPSVPAYYPNQTYVKPFGQWGEQVFPELSTPAEVLAHLDELHVSHILDVQSTISGFRVTPDTPGLILIFSAPGQRVYRVAAPK